MESLKHSREDALALLYEYTQNESLRKHALGVEAAMRWYARHLDQPEDLWAVTGLLHDFDYERFPQPSRDGHPFVGCRMLTELGYPESVTQAILGHANYSGVSRDTLLAKALFACDELSGLITASVLVRPDRSIHELSVQSVKKKMKDKAFAKGVSREDIRVGAEELGIELDQHIANVISGMQEAAEQLGLAGSTV